MSNIQYRLLSWKHGGLIIQESHPILASKLTKKENVGTMSKWKDVKYPTIGGLGISMMELLREDGGHIGDFSDETSMVTVVNHLADIEEGIGKRIEFQLKERNKVADRILEIFEDNHNADMKEIGKIAKDILRQLEETGIVE